MKKSVLFVCLGNICRSPAAEAIFLHYINKKELKDYYSADSAGTGGWHVGNKADPRMRNTALKRGIFIESIARKIELQDFQRFDYILTMDNSNLEEVNSLSEKVNDNNKSLIRPILSYASRTDLIEVPDPYYGGDAGFDNVLDLLEDSIEGFIRELN